MTPSDVIPHKALLILDSAGIDMKYIASARIETGTWKSRMITTILRSAATVINNRIYFREGYYNPDTIMGMILIAHEIVHVQQWQQFKSWFLILYLIEFFRYWLLSLMIKLRRPQTALPMNWVHDQNRFEIEAEDKEQKVYKYLLSHPG